MNERDHYRALLVYTGWANGASLDALAAAFGLGLPETARADLMKAQEVLSHIVRAQMVWLGRVEGSDAAQMPFWRPDPIDDLPGLSEASTRAWLEHIDAAEDLGRPVRYVNTRGEAFASPLREIITHVVHHGTYHRGQVALLVRRAGGAPPLTDYIHYVRSVAAGRGG